MWFGERREEEEKVGTAAEQSLYVNMTTQNTILKRTRAHPHTGTVRRALGRERTFKLQYIVRGHGGP